MHCFLQQSQGAAPDRALPVWKGTLNPKPYTPAGLVANAPVCNPVEQDTRTHTPHFITTNTQPQAQNSVGSLLLSSDNQQAPAFPACYGTNWSPGNKLS